MRTARSFGLAALAVAALLPLGGSAAARNPQNPYSSFNLSGINYGSMQWEKAQRQGKRVWPYYNTPARSYSRGSTVTAGGVGGVGGGGVRTSPRRWRR